jgi:hypothetical protein
VLQRHPPNSDMVRVYADHIVPCLRARLQPCQSALSAKYNSLGRSRGPRPASLAGVGSRSQRACSLGRRRPRKKSPRAAQPLCRRRASTPEGRALAPISAANTKTCARPTTHPDPKTAQNSVKPLRSPDSA